MTVQVLISDDLTPLARKFGAKVTDFFEESFGLARRYRQRFQTGARLLDGVYDAAITLSPARLRLDRRSQKRNILVTGIEVPNREGQIHSVIDTMTKGTRHAITKSVIPMEDRGKFSNIDAAISLVPGSIDSFDWIIIVDDDVAFPYRFLDLFIAISEAADFSIVQPSHCFNSYATFRITQRRFATLARQTRFVEIGPLTALRRDTFANLIPFPESRWCYGIDVYWTWIAEQHGWKMGIVDATPVNHLRPVARSYDKNAAYAEGAAFLKEKQIALRRKELLADDRVAVPWLSIGSATGS